MKPQETLSNIIKRMKWASTLRGANVLRTDNIDLTTSTVSSSTRNKSEVRRTVSYEIR